LSQDEGELQWQASIARDGRGADIKPVGEVGLHCATPFSYVIRVAETSD